MPSQWRIWNSQAPENRPRVILQTTDRPIYRRPPRADYAPSSTNISLPSRRQWFIDDVWTRDGWTHYCICIWLWQDELHWVAHLSVMNVEIRKTSAGVCHYLQLWLPETQLPESKMSSFRQREERMRSLRSFWGWREEMHRILLIAETLIHLSLCFVGLKVT